MCQLFSAVLACLEAISCCAAATAAKSSVAAAMVVAGGTSTEFAAAAEAATIRRVNLGADGVVAATPFAALNRRLRRLLLCHSSRSRQLLHSQSQSSLATWPNRAVSSTTMILHAIGSIFNIMAVVAHVRRLTYQVPVADSRTGLNAKRIRLSAEENTVHCLR